VSGNTAIIGAAGKTIGSNVGQGAAYVFTCSGTPCTWTQQQELTASDGARDDVFGYSVAASELPAMSRAAGSMPEQMSTILRTRLNRGLRQIAFMVVPSSAAFLILGDVIVAMIYQSGAFTRADAVYVWAVLAGSGVGLLAATMGRLFSRSMPDWSDRAAVAEFAARGAEILGDDPAAARAIAGRKWDRTPGTEPAVQMANQLGMVFAKLDCTPRWRGRLSELAIPVLVVHGRRDPFFPVGNGEALTREIPGARLLVLERAATAIPDAAADEVAAAMLAL